MSNVFELLVTLLMMSSVSILRKADLFNGHQHERLELRGNHGCSDDSCHHYGITCFCKT